jgi:hypothetical protein
LVAIVLFSLWCVRRVQFNRESGNWDEIRSSVIHFVVFDWMYGERTWTR